MGRHYSNFDWLRLAFAVQVVAIHAGIAKWVFINPVPAFLAISGFVVLGSMERNPGVQFFINRALRVLPLLFVSFLVVGYLYGEEEMFHTFLFWLWPFGPEPINAVVWSLIYEEVFYLLLALLYFAGLYRWIWTPIILGAVCIYSVATFTWFGLPPGFLMLGCAFFIGNVAYFLRAYIERIPSLAALAVFVASTAWVMTRPYTDIIPHSEFWVDMVSFGAMLVFAVSGPSLPRLKADFSYSLYLFHCILRGELLRFMPIGNFLFSFMLLSTLPICAASWYLIEKPALSLKKRRISRAEPVAAE